MKSTKDPTDIGKTGFYSSLTIDRRPAQDVKTNERWTVEKNEIKGDRK